MCARQSSPYFTNMHMDMYMCMTVVKRSTSHHVKYARCHKLAPGARNPLLNKTDWRRLRETLEARPGLGLCSGLGLHEYDAACEWRHADVGRHLGGRVAAEELGTR